MPKKTLKKV